MEKDIGQLEIPMHDLVLDQSMEGIQDLAEVLDDILFRQNAFIPYLGQHISSIAIFQHQVVIVRCFLQSVQLDYVGIIAGLQDFYLVLQQLVKFAWVIHYVPLIMSLRMDLMATSSRVSWCLPR